ncbi:MAG: hypothetical protein R3253_11795 [Longimicrobiales bacterium]|nr:hypothetical protein [Longimicrobiales bacterium]
MIRRSRRRIGLAGGAALALTLIAGCSDATAPVGLDGPKLQLSLVGPQAVSQAELDALADAFDQVDEYRISIVDSGTLANLVETTVPISTGASQHILDIPVPETAFGRSVIITLVAYGNGVELYRSVRVLTLADEAGVLSLNLEIRYTGPGIRGVVSDVNGDGVGGVGVSLLQGRSVVDAVVTEADGSYLFLDVATGVYQVAPSPTNAFPYLCPGVRDVTVDDVDDAVTADFLATDDVCGTSVLVVSGGDFDDTQTVRTLLENDPSLSVSTFFFVNQLPGADLLARHDVVLLFMNGLFDESAALGTQIADYVSAGGNVVLASFYWQGRSDSGLGSVGWGSLETIDPFLSTGGATYQSDALGTTTAHPLTAGVNTLFSASGHRGGVQAKSGTSVVATWSDTTPFIGYRVLAGGQRIVGVTLFPAGGPNAVSGDVQAVWENAVGWAGAAGGPVPASEH